MTDGANSLRRSRIFQILNDPDVAALRFL